MKTILTTALVLTAFLLPQAARAIDVTIQTDNEEWGVSDKLMSFHITYDSVPDWLLDETSTLQGKSVTLAGRAAEAGVAAARFPGGTVVKNWDWETAATLPKTRGIQTMTRAV